MGVVTRAKKRRLEVLEEEEERVADWISRLPDDVLGAIVSLLPTKDGARTQVLSSRWHHVWRSAPLNLDFNKKNPVGREIVVASASDISRILSAHHGPGRRFVMPVHYKEYPSLATLDGWLRSPALDNLQELDCHDASLTLLEDAPWVHRFSSSLRVANFGFGGGIFTFPYGNNASALCFPVLQQLTLLNVSISKSSLHALLAWCPIMESLLIDEIVHPLQIDSLGSINVHSPWELHIVSRSLRSIGVHTSWLYHRLSIVIEDAPCLERLLYSEGIIVDISLISAPRLVILGGLFRNYCHPGYLYEGDAFLFQGSNGLSMTAVLPSVKVLSLSDCTICLEAAINLVKCFPHMERLYIKANDIWLKGVSYYKYQKLIRTLDIRLRKIVLVNYVGSKSHINFVKLFVSTARVLESLRLELAFSKVSDSWISRQHKRLHIEKRASRGAQITFVPPSKMIGPADDLLGAEKVHDLSTDPFQRFH